MSFCRITKKKITDIMSFGSMPLANGFLKKEQFKKEYFFELKIAFNKELSLFQLVKNPNPKKMFNKNYPFYTSGSKYMIRHFEVFSSFIKKKYLQNGSILELGSNDGTFLKNFKNNDHVGFEPSKNVHVVAQKNKVISVNKFFNKKNYKKIFKKKKFDVIVGSNVFCHIPNQNELINTIDNSLSENGTLIFEDPYLGSMYKKTSYDQIYDEHIYMFSASSVQKIYQRFGFELIDAIPQKTHGGSLRYIIKRKNTANKTKRLLNILRNEKRKNIDSIKGCIKFKNKVLKSKIKILKILNQIKKKKEKICGYGATSKSTTILNFCGINNKTIDCIYDTTPDKIGKYSPGMHIPISNYKNFRNSKYKYVFLFAWNHKDEILKKEKHKKKVKWITHINLKKS
jgi:methylation protein EvaC